MKHIIWILAATALAAFVAVTPVAAGNPPPAARSEYNWGVCKVGTSKCPIRYNPPQWLGQSAERAGKVWDNFRATIRRTP